MRPILPRTRLIWCAKDSETKRRVPKWKELDPKVDLQSYDGRFDKVTRMVRGGS